MLRAVVTRLAYTPAYTPGRVVGLLRAPSLREAVDGRTVLVTGASSGIGRAAAVRLAGAGARVLLVARKAEALDAVAAEIGPRAEVRPCDLADPAAIDGLVADVLAAHGGVDVLINSAGLSIRRSIGQSVERPYDRERVMALNFHGAVNLTLGLLGAMRERGRGHVINVSSMAAIASPPRFSAYAASKAALDAFSRTLAHETRHTGIRVTTVLMPLVRTPMIAPTAAYADAAALTPEQAADLLAEAVRTRPPHIAPRAALAMSAARLLAPESFETAMNRAYLASRPLTDNAVAGGGRELVRRVGRALSIRM